MEQINWPPTKTNLYYSDKWVAIYHADCRQLLPQLDVKVDLVLTDPPYGRNEIKNNPSRGKLAVSKDYGLGEWDKQPADKELLDMIISKGNRSIIFGGNYFGLPASSCWLVWDKDNQGNDFADCELAWTNFNSAIRKYLWRWNGMLQEPGCPKEYRQHPTQKPSGLFSLIIADYSKESALILDPFLGSGTTCYCAKKLNRYSIGIEIEERYCQIAADRCRQMTLPMDTEQIQQGQSDSQPLMFNGMTLPTKRNKVASKVSIHNINKEADR